MTVEELDIIVQTNVEKAIKEFQKLLPAIKKQLSDIKKEFNKLDLKQVIADIDMSKVTKKIQQVKKHIKESFKEASNISINIKPKIQTSSKDNIGQENQLEQETEQTGASQNKTTGFFNGFKEKIEQIKPALSKVNSMFGNIGNKIFKWINPMDIAKKSISNMHSKIKTMGNALKEGVVHILKQASSLIGLKNIYSTLSGCAQTWLSSQNSGAQQLSANIEYMKYSMGSVFAPVIEYVINLAYQLMKAIQSLVYAFSGINIFAKSTASSMGKTANNAKQASKSLSGVHGEINNVSESDSSGGGSGGLISPSMDLSQMENTPNTIIDAIKNGNWFEVGALIGEKLNNAMLSIPWDKIQNGAQNIASGIAQTLNGYIAGVDWNLAGNTLAQGLNTIIYFAYTFVTTFDWAQFGTAIGDSINGFFLNVDWAIAGQTLGEGIKGIFDSITSFLNEVDWTAVGESIKTFIQNIDWEGIWESIKETIKGVIGATDGILTGLFGEDTASIIEAIAIAIGVVTIATQLYTLAKLIETGVLKANIATWMATNLPIILITAAIAALIAIIILIAKHWEEISAVLLAGWEWIKQKATEIFTAIGEFFRNIWQGICDTVTTIWNNICNFFKEIWNWIVQTVTNTFNNIKQFIGEVLNAISTIWNNIWNGISTFISNIWNGIVTIVTNVINRIKDTISNILNTIKGIWSSIWTGIKNTVVNIWNGIWSCIKGVINSILSGIENMVNGVIRGVNFILSGISNIANAIGGLVGMSPINLKLNYISLPRLAKGNVAYSPIIAQFGEYAGANHNPEITAPQNILKETFQDVLSNYEWNNNGNSSGELKQVVFQFGSYRVATEIESLLKQARRQNGIAKVNV